MEHGEQQERSCQEMQSLFAALACLFVLYILMARLRSGLLRFFCVLPCLPIFAMVPFSTRSHAVRSLLSFMFLWVCPSKLFLRCWDIAPDYPGDGFIYFVITSVMPLRIKGRTHPPDKDRRPASAQGALFLPLLYFLGFYGTMNIFWYFNTSSWLNNVLYCLFVYLGLEGVLGLLSTLTSLLLRVELHPFFDKPFLASSLSEFWGRRWNRLASYMLRETVYVPILHFLSAGRGKHVAELHASPLIMSNGSSQEYAVVQSADVGRLFSLRGNGGADASNGMMQEKAKTNFGVSSKELNVRKVPLPARVIAMLASFIASGLMHELIFFCITQTRATWEVTMFFILHGVISIVEVFLRRKFPSRRKLPRPVAIVCTLAFLYFSAAWLFMPPIARTGVDMRILAEYRHMPIAIVNLFRRQ